MIVDELGWRTQEQVSFRFLETFMQKWDTLLTAVSSYLALWTRFQSSFEHSDMKRLERELIRSIKGNLVQVASVVEALNKKNKNRDVQDAVEQMRKVYQEIIDADYITREQLELLNNALAVVLAEQFLAPLMRWRGGTGERTYGKVEKVE